MKYDERKDRYLQGILLVILIGYAFFLTSKIWLPPDEAEIPPTEPGYFIEGNDRKVTLVSWTYDEEKREMEVMLDITNMSIDGINRYRWSAMELNKGRLTVTPIVEQDDFVVLRIENIPRRFEEISLRMGISSEDQTNVDGEFTDLKIYGSKDSVTRGSIEDDMNERDYRIAACREKISIYEENISALEIRIADEKNIIAEAEKTIKRLEEGIEYQTESEIASTSSAIADVSSKIDTAESNIQSYEKEIAELEEKILLQREVESKL